MTTETLLINLREINEERAPDWRWRRAILLEERQSPIRNIEDEMVSKLRKYIREVKLGRETEELAYNYPIFYEVNRIYSDAKATRWLLEALIMANTPPQEIANRFGWKHLGVNLVLAYEALKFDVRSRLKFDAFVLSTILGITEVGQLPPSEERVYKVLGWIGMRKEVGTALLDGYINLEAMTEEVKKWYDQFVDHQLTRRTVRSLFKFDPMQSPQLVNLIGVWNEHQKLVMERRIQGLGVESSELENAQSTLIQSLSMTVADISAVSASEVEPRAMAMLESAVSEGLKNDDSNATGT